MLAEMLAEFDPKHGGEALARSEGADNERGFVPAA